MNKSFKTWVVFDFDGTLADSALESLTILKRLAPQMGFRRVEDEDVEYLRGKTTKEILKFLDIGPLLLPRVVYKCRKELENRFKTIESHVSNDEWEKLLSLGCGIGIVTSNSLVNVETFLERNFNSRPHFVHAGTSIFGKKKTLFKLCKKLKMEKGLYIGDETRDIVAAKAAGWVAGSVSWGFNRQPILESFGPYKMFTDPSQLSSEIGKVVRSWQEKEWQ